MNITCLIGPVGSGKSSYMDRFNTDHCVKLFPGAIFRQLLGERYFLDHATPNDPMELDKLVFLLLQESIWLAASHSRHLVVDGFPRSSRQVDLLLQAVQTYTNVRMDLEVLAFVVSESEQLAQCKERNKGDMSPMDEARIIRSRTDFSATVKRLELVEKNPGRFGFEKFRIEYLRNRHAADAADQDRQEDDSAVRLGPIADMPQEDWGCGP